MNKKLIQAICYVLIAVAACILSVSGRIPSVSKEKAVPVKTETAGSLKTEESGSSAVASSTAKDGNEPADEQAAALAKAGTAQADASDTPQMKDLKENTQKKEKAKKEKAKEEIEEETAEAETEEETAEAATEEKTEEEIIETNTDDSAPDTAEEKNGPFYTYRITMSPDALRIYSSIDGQESIGSIPSGYRGYVIARNGGYRSLVLYRGIVGYCSNMYLEMTQIPPEEYPDELVGLGVEEIGTTLFDGNAIGTVENAN